MPRLLGASGKAFDVDPVEAVREGIPSVLRPNTGFVSRTPVPEGIVEAMKRFWRRIKTKNKGLIQLAENDNVFQRFE